jgi:multiple sugar transport system ATP-binding protein
MGFSLKLRGESRAIIAERVNKAAETLGLTGYLDRRPAALSGGQRQRVAMGRAIVRDPEVFLFAEPLSNLDAQLRVAMRSEIKALHQRLKTTVVYVTHDQVEAMTMADRIAVMNEGRIEQLGEPLELYDRPANLFVAQFIGSPAMNLFSGKVTHKGGRPQVALEVGAVVALPTDVAAEEGKRLTVGVRPEHFGIANGEGSLAAKVDVVEPLGSQMQVSLSCASQPFIAIFNERLSCVPGDTMHLVPRAGFLHLFDAESGRRIATGL